MTRTASARRAPGRSLPRPASRPGPSRSWLWLAGLGAGALLVRLAAALELHGTPVFELLVGDGRQYDAWARTIASGQWIGTEVFYQTPLYPYLLAVLYKVAGHHVMLVRILQSVLGAASCVLIARAGARFFGRAAGLIAGLLLAIYPSAIFFDLIIQKASLDLFLFTLTLALVGEFRARPHWGWIAGAGAAIAAFTVNRENARVLYPIVVAWLGLGAWPVRPAMRARWIATFTAAMAVVLLPVGLRNYHVGGQFLVSTAQLGPNFYIGNHDGASGVYEPLVADRGDVAFERADAARIAEAAEGRRLTPGEVSDYWIGRGLRYVRNQPGAWLTLMGKKLLRIVSAAEVSDTESVEAYSDYSAVLRGLRWLDYGVILSLGTLGVWLTRRDWRQLCVLYAAFAGMALAVALFYVVARYRYPLVPIVLLFAGAAIAEWRSIGLGAVRTWLPGAALAVAVGVTAHTVMHDTGDGTYMNLGAEFVAAGRPADAVPLLERAVAAAPDHAGARFNLGLALNATGDTTRAIDAFAAAVRARPGFGLAESALAIALAGSGRPAEALPHFEAAVRADPTSAEARCSFGRALAESGQAEAATAQFQEALSLKPGDARAEHGLGVVLQQEGRNDEAIAAYRAALAADPAFAEAHSALSVALAAAGDREGAVAHLEEAVRLRPGSFGIQMNAGQLLARLGRTGDAIVRLEHAMAIARAAGQADAVRHIDQMIGALRAR